MVVVHKELQELNVIYRWETYLFCPARWLTARLKWAVRDIISSSE
ncbi:MAG: hypothetical protein ACE5PV_19225 [Candidatus Poribacteria bacterium]